MTKVKKLTLEDKVKKALAKKYMKGNKQTKKTKKKVEKKACLYTAICVNVLLMCPAGF
jgi:hypothetical protein